MEKPTYVKGNSFLNTFASSCDNEDIASTGRDHLPKWYIIAVWDINRTNGIWYKGGVKNRLFYFF